MAKSKKTKAQILQKLCEYIKTNAPKETTANLTAFAKVFYDTIAAEDLRTRTIEDLYGAVFSLWGFIRQNKNFQSKVHVYNPSHDQHGWQSTHTVIEVSHSDMPFLLDSICMEVNRMGLLVHISIHSGCFYFVRDKQGNITGVLSKKEGEDRKLTPEAVLYLEVDRLSDKKICKKLQDNITRILRDVTVAVEDWKPICSVVEKNLMELEACATQLEQAEYEESKDFLQWLLNNHFTFLGSREYTFVGGEGDEALHLTKNSGLGVLRESADTGMLKSLTELPPKIREIMLSNQILLIAKTNTVSTIHRGVYTDYIGIKRFDKDGNAIGLTLIIGLYTSTAYNSNPSFIPFLRRKIATILERSALSMQGHAGKALLNILETLPRDDLFQASTDELYELSMGILHLQERQRTKFFMLKDPYNRYYSCLVYVPRDRFNTDLRRKMGKVLMDALGGTESTFSTQFSDSILARVHFVIRTDPAALVDFDKDEIEQMLISTTRLWRDELREQLTEYYGEAQGIGYYSKYKEAFSTSYCEEYTPRNVIYDISHIEKLSSENVLEMSLQQTHDDYNAKLQLKLFSYISSSPLSDVLPLLENLGLRVLDEQPSAVHFENGQTIWINDFQMVHGENREINIDEIREPFKEAFSRIWFGEAEDDKFNRLILAAQLTWKETTLLRAYSRYLKQVGFTFSQDYIANTLYHNPKIARELAVLFKARFDPDYTGRSDKLLTRLKNKIKKNLDAVASLDEDRILRRMLSLVLATIRTNYFVKAPDGGELPYISFKLDPHQIPDMPLPRPMYEIFVYSPRVEGVHLRGAKVARGGLRWSDRREDFRTEILGLMKAQQVKNAVIVPLGAKGGFVTKELPSDGTREEVMQEVIHCYQTFIKGLLDVTDNIVESEIVHPDRVVRYDEEDPYLVVAADKGTATFSDIANSISEQYGFWLGDAFASGGSTGYDHKKMGITARGAWESAKRNFREVLGIDTQTMPFTVAGVGDMAGDVFGNGMLLSKHIRLVAAFNHMHIFIDPDPDEATSYKERQRLFNLPRSSWEDYDKKLISKGGGVFKRSEKSIKLSAEIRKVLDLDVAEIAPNDLIKAILKSQVDMFWNGGIGTFIKASTESHRDAGDRASDAIRVNANELRCKIVGEGGNLGLTQQGRIEFALNGGRINTDFIDNSAGVDCSDHEVNIKILLNSIVANGDLTVKQRNKMLLDMTDEVAELVLNNNYLQSETISLEEFSSAETIDLFQRYVINLEKTGKIDRELEGLPSDETIIERKGSGQGFTRPEISVLISYDKTLLKEEILASDLPEDAYFIDMLQSAFPKVLSKKYAKEMEAHSLRREIIATQLSNCVTNTMGINFVSRLKVETGASTPFIVRAFVATQELFGLKDVWAKVRKQDCKINSETQFNMTLQLYFLARRATRWFLRNYSDDFDICAVVHQFSNAFKELKTNIPKILTSEQRDLVKQKKEDYISQGVPTALADEMSRYLFLFNALDIMQSGKSTKFTNLDVAKMYFLLSSRLDLSWLREKIITHKIETQWDELARSVLLDDLDFQQRILTLNVLEHRKKSQSLEEAFADWQETYARVYNRWSGFLTDVLASQHSGFIMYSVVMKELYDLARAGKELKA